MPLPFTQTTFYDPQDLLWGDLEDASKLEVYSLGGIELRTSRPVYQNVCKLTLDGLHIVRENLLPTSVAFPGEVFHCNSFRYQELDYHVEWSPTQGTPKWGTNLSKAFSFVVQVESKFDTSPLFYFNWSILAGYASILYAFYSSHCGYSFDVSVDLVYRDLSLVGK